MKVWVVMGNDYPAATFSDEAKATAYIERRKAADATARHGLRPIYWRAYDFELDKDGPA